MRIIGISAKKQGGKDTAGKYITGKVLKDNNAIRDFKIDDDGSLSVLTMYADGTEAWGVLDLQRKDPDFIHAAENTIWPWVKVYSFADPLKQLGMELFGLSYEAVYGNEEQRAAPTHLLWENMPGVITPEKPAEIGLAFPEDINLITHEPGPMSGREFLQFFGTEIGRKMYPQIWVNATINKILAEKPTYALITDVRFPDEVEAIQAVNGEVLRLMRQVSQDSHESETALDDYPNFDFKIDNGNLSINKACEAVCKALEI